MTERDPILVAMSGGVDSSVAAALLKRAGVPIVGVFMRGSTPVRAPSSGRPRGCCSEIDAADVRRVADRLGIPFYVKNLGAGFADLKAYFAESYHAGRTPNPCIRCNKTLKFGALLDLADQMGCRAVATGHYVRREERPDGTAVIRRGLDDAKDQSYVLLSLDQSIVQRTRFPLGDLTKPEVREIAQSLGLGIADKPESMEVCFVPDDYRDFLAKRDPDRIRPGRFVDAAGNDLGEHPGHQLFTIGQRKGLGIAFGEPRYVIGKDAAANRVVLGTRDELGFDRVIVEDVGWISCAPWPVGTTRTLAVQIRHRHRPAPARVTAEEDGTLAVTFLDPVASIAAGQGAAVFDDDVLLAGGWIRQAERVPVADDAAGLALD